MVGERKIKRDYVTKCDCGELIQIDITEHEDFFSGQDEKNKVTILAGECPKCNRSLIINRNDIGKKIFPLFKGKFKAHWGNN